MSSIASRSCSRRLRDPLPRLLAERAVGLAKVFAHLLERLLAAIELHGHGPADLLILLIELVLLDLQRDILFAEQATAVAVLRS